MTAATTSVARHHDAPSALWPGIFPLHWCHFALWRPRLREAPVFTTVLQRQHFMHWDGPGRTNTVKSNLGLVRKSVWGSGVKKRHTGSPLKWFTMGRWFNWYKDHIIWTLWIIDFYNILVILLTSNTLLFEKQMTSNSKILTCLGDKKSKWASSTCTVFNLSVFLRNYRHWQGGNRLQGPGCCHPGGIHAEEGGHGEEGPAESQRGHLQEPRVCTRKVLQEDCQSKPGRCQNALGCYKSVQIGLMLCIFRCLWSGTLPTPTAWLQLSLLPPSPKQTSPVSPVWTTTGLALRYFLLLPLFTLQFNYWHL